MPLRGNVSSGWGWDAGKERVRELNRTEGKTYRDLKEPEGWRFSSFRKMRLQSISAGF